jgi:hypothetical protein
VTKHAVKDGVRRQVFDYVNKINEFQFVLCDLIPYLEFLASGNVDKLSPPHHIKLAVADMVKRAQALKYYRKPKPTPAIEPDLVREVLRVPCKVTNSLITPLQPVGARPKETNDIIIQGIRYQPCTRQSYPLNDVLKELEGATSNNGLNCTTDNYSSNIEAGALLNQIQNIIDMFEPAKNGPYCVLYKDQHNQIQYSKKGYFALIRGPLPTRNSHGQVYVGLIIAGRTRKEFLSRSPRCCKTTRELWTSTGLPASGGMCVGRRSQYSLLSSNIMTDSEAVVLWVDVGVRLATGISAFHRRWRNMKRRRLLQMPVSKVR